MLFQAYKNLSSTMRIGVGVGIIAWGAIGLYLSDRAEERYGLTPSEADKAALEKVTPKILVVDRPKGE
ncbi:hypothetical protein SAPIO_CDS7138 [Scedosporium apiospermum]|uniref:Uncharacterized protein n=1 Tax=Pseudallescheria apiosperma TaxID=563466 RepID=A0A084G170_PSEDA|nr:uncharacterized protein SAPIO_CDS7138 [Scedosporium apiospermum]KEZ41082.1 hypothetical protein SAPIO_CDS7138 [Scedosporium apiospermum]